MPLFYKWSGCCNIHQIEAKYHAYIEQTINGSHKVKKMHGYDVPTFRIRLDGANRLLFRTKMIDGRAFISIYALVLNHNYSAPSFIEDEIDAEFLVSQSNEELDEDAYYAEDAIPFGEHAIILNEAQSSVTINSYPTIISGAAGSGKSYVGLQILRQCIDAGHTNLVCITQNTNIRDYLQRLWGEISPESVYTLLFETYYDFTVRHDPSLATYTLVEFDEFKQYVSTIKKRLSINFSAELIYEEFRSIPSTLEEYQNYGQRSSLFDHESRVEIWNLYIKYKQKIQQEKKIDLSIYDLNLNNNDVDVVFVDEALDFSLKQLKLLLSSAKDSKIYYAMDSHQNLYHRRSLRPIFWHYLTTVTHGQAQHVLLPGNYRSPPSVLEAVNKWIELKRLWVGGITDDAEALVIHPMQDITQTNSLRFMNHDYPSCLSLRVFANSANTVIITNINFIDEAIERFGFTAAMVGTPEDFKGMEIDHVIIYRLLDDPSFKKMNEALTEPQDTLKISKHRAMRNNNLFQHTGLVNSVFVALTRAKKTCYFLQTSDIKKNHLILHHLKSTQLTNVCEKIDITELPKSSREDWLNTAKNFLLQGHIDRSKAIYLQHIGNNENFKDWSIKFLPKTTTEKSEKKIVKKRSTANLQAIESYKKIPIKTYAPPKKSSYIKALSINEVYDLIINDPFNTISQLLSHQLDIKYLFDTISINSFSEKIIYYIFIDRSLCVIFNRILLSLSAQTLNDVSLLIVLSKNNFLTDCIKCDNRVALEWYLNKFNYYKDSMTLLDDRLQHPYILAVRLGRLSILTQISRHIKYQLIINNITWDLYFEPLYRPANDLLNNTIFTLADNQDYNLNEIYTRLSSSDKEFIELIKKSDPETDLKSKPGVTRKLIGAQVTEIQEALFFYSFKDCLPFIISEYNTASQVMLLFLAIEFNYVNIIKSFFSKLSTKAIAYIINQCTIYNLSPLCLAVQNGSNEITSLLLNLGADVNIATTHGISPIVAAIKYARTSILPMLLSKKLDLTVYYNDKTILEYAEFTDVENNKKFQISSLTNGNSNIIKASWLPNIMKEITTTANAINYLDVIYQLKNYPLIISMLNHKNILFQKHDKYFLEEILSSKENTIAFIKLLKNYQAISSLPILFIPYCEYITNYKLPVWILCITALSHILKGVEIQSTFQNTQPQRACLDNILFGKLNYIEVAQNSVYGDELLKEDLFKPYGFMS